MKASQKVKSASSTALSGLNNTVRGNKMPKWTQWTHILYCFFPGNFSKLKASCDVKAAKGSKRNLNLLQIPSFDFDKNIHLHPCFCFPKFLQ